MKQILTLLLFIGCSMYVNAQTVPTEELKLTDAQKVQVEKIQKATETDIKTILPMMKTNPAEFHAKRKAITTSSDKSILALLQEPQRKVYNKIIEMRETVFSQQFQPVNKRGSN
jgi:hypothetical protein